MKWLVTAFILFQVAAAHAAGLYDGTWSGKLSGALRGGGLSPACSGSLTAVVTDGSVEGKMVITGNSPTLFAGTIDPDGRYQSARGLLSGKFAGDSFTGIYMDGGACVWTVTMDRS